MQNEMAEVKPKQNEIAIIANKITSGLAAFETRKAELLELKSNAEGLKITSLEDKESIGKVSVWRKKLKSARVEIEKEGKGMRDPLTQINKNISAKEKELIELISPTENALKSQEDWVKQEEEKIRLEEERKDQQRIQDRIDKLAQYGYAIDITFLKGLDDEQFSGVVDGARIEFEKEELNKLELARLEKEKQEQIKRDQEELRLLREKQEKADLILKERQDELDRQAKELKAQQDRMAEEAIKKEKTERDAEIKRRVSQLASLGLSFNFNANQYEGFDCAVHYFDITGFDQEKWDGVISKMQPHIESFKKDLAEKTEQKRLADLQAAKDQAIVEEKERQRIAIEKEAEAKRIAVVKRQEELEKAGDRAIWNDFISRLQEVECPTPKSGQYRKIAAIAREKMEEIRSLKP